MALGGAVGGALVFHGGVPTEHHSRLAVFTGRRGAEVAGVGQSVVTRARLSQVPAPGRAVTVLRVLPPHAAAAWTDADQASRATATPTRQNKVSAVGRNLRR
jgi:hypothetical protein